MLLRLSRVAESLEQALQNKTAKVARLLAGESYIKHVPSEWIGSWLQAGQFTATAEMQRLAEADAVLICVPTPLTDSRDPDLSYVESTANYIAAVLRPGQLIVLESTTYPGTTRDVVLPILEKTGLKIGEDFYLAYSPEREDPGNPSFTASSIPKVVGGIDARSARLAELLYSGCVEQVVPVSTCEIAEACKILENTYRSVNIAMVNELKVLFQEMGIDVWEVIDAARTKPFGFQAFYPGPGLGGHCIPVDPFYLSCVGILGVAYKKDVDDPRESPAFRLMELLQRRGAILSYNDPFIPVLPSMRHYDAPRLASETLTPEFLASQDCVLIATDHSSYDWETVVEYSRLVVDTRNAMRDVKGNRDKIFKA